MSKPRKEFVQAALRRAYGPIDYNTYNNVHNRYEFRKQRVLADESLTSEEKTVVIRKLNEDHERYKVLYNEGTKRICDNCNQECLAVTFCELCVRNYLRVNFSNWTSGNDNIDNLIQTCQMKTLVPNLVAEWIPYDNLQNIKYLTEGGFSKIYTADWINGRYMKWNFKKQQLTRHGRHSVILKSLEKVENANRSWLEEAKSHLTISNKWSDIVTCFGLTQDPSNKNYMLVMSRLEIDLRKYLQKNHNQLTWKERLQIIENTANALLRIHQENAIHRDLHSGNILHSQYYNFWYISDLGFCGPADKSSKSVYGNLPYIAPEVIAGEGYTFASDIYSVGILMWEISSGQLPFSNYDHNTDLATNIVNGMRPNIISGTPLEYENLMKQCWDADSSKRPNSSTLWRKISEINFNYQNISNDQSMQYIVNSSNNLNANVANSKLFTSRIYEFKNMPIPRNATEEKQKEFYRDSRIYDISISDNIENLDDGF